MHTCQKLDLYSNDHPYTGRLVLPFWCWLIQVVLEKRPLTWVPSSSTSSSSKDLYKHFPLKATQLAKLQTDRQHAGSLIV